MSQKVYIKTYGCQMNLYDSIKMGELLKPHGFEQSDDVSGADVVVLNTCHVREKAAEKVYCELGRIRELKEYKKSIGEEMVIAVAGCVAQAEGDAILARAPYVDMVLGPQSYHELPRFLAQLRRDGKSIVELNFDAEQKFDALKEEVHSQGVVAYIAVQEGCDKFCHFCIVPYTRGAEYSRSVADVYREALELVSKGAKEIQLLGQNVSAYHGAGPDGDVWTLAKLIRHLANIRGLERIRYTTSHPTDMTDPDLFAVHKEIAQLMPFLHLPVQAGADNTLKAMNRRHTRDSYLRIIESFRDQRPDMGFSSDFIVGFPGETDADFEQTLQIVREVEFAQCYSFKYSPRPGTPAAIREDQVPEEVKSARLQELQALIHTYQKKFNDGFMGRKIKVLFEKEGKHPGQLSGRSEYMQAVFANAPASALNQIVEVMVESIEPHSLGCVYHSYS